LFPDFSPPKVLITSTSLTTDLRWRRKSLGKMASPPVKGGESRRSLVQMDSMVGMDGKGGAVGKQIMAAAPETPVKPQEPLVASPSNTKKNAYLDFGKDDDVREASVKTLPGTTPFHFPSISLSAVRSVWRSVSLES
jgi:hypothetical protein